MLKMMGFRWSVLLMAADPTLSPEGPFASTGATPRWANVRIVPNVCLQTLGARTLESLVFRETGMPAVLAN